MSEQIPTLATAGEQRSQSFRWLALLLGVLGYIDVQMNFLSVAPVLPEIARSLHVDPGQATILLMSAYLGAGSITWIFIGGHICDRYGVFTTLLIGFLCQAAPAALTPWIGASAGGVLAARLLEGLAVGLMFPTIAAIGNTLFPPRQRGMANGLMNAAVAVGNSAGVFLGPILVLAVGGDWRWMPAALSLYSWASLVFGLALYALYNKRLPRHAAADERAGQGAEFRRALLAPFTLVGVTVSILSDWAVICFFSLMATYLAAAPPLGVGYGALLAGRLTLGATLVGGVVGPILGGFLLDKVFHGRAKWVLALGFAVACVCALLLKSPAVTGNIPVLEAALVAGGVAVMFTFPTMFYMTACSYAPRVVGKMNGLWCGLGNCGAVLGLYIAGLSMKAFHSFQPTLDMIAATSAAGFALTFLLVRLRQRYLAAQTD
jgi:MFS family permease